jgi:hypothetical protein
MTAVHPMTKARDASARGSSDRASEKSGRRLALLGLAGILAALALLTATTLVGAALRDGYDPVRDAISRLTKAGGPNAEWLRVLTTAYAALLIPFAYACIGGLPQPATVGSDRSSWAQRGSFRCRSATTPAATAAAGRRRRSAAPSQRR